MKTTERTIPFLSRHMVAVLTELVANGGEITTSEARKKISVGRISVTGDDAASPSVKSTTLTALTNLKRVNLLDKADTIGSPYTLKDTAKTKLILELLSGIDGYGLTEPENTQLNRADRFIKTWSSDYNQPVRPNGKEWELMRQSLRNGQRLGRAKSFLQDCGKGLYKIEESFFEKLLVWRRIAAMVSIIGYTPKPLSLRSREKFLEKCMDLVYINWNTYSMLAVFAGGGIYSSTQLKQLVLQGYLPDHPKHTSLGMYSSAIDALTRLDLIEKVGGQLHSPHRVKDAGKAGRICDLIESIQGFGTDPTEHTVLRAGSIVLDLQPKEDMLDDQDRARLVSARVCLTEGVYRKGMTTLLVTAAGASGGRKPISLTEDFKAKIQTWRDITELVWS